MVNPLNWNKVLLGDIVDFFDHQRIPLSSRERQKRQGPYPYYGASGIIDYLDDYIFDGKYLLVAEDGENLNSRKTPVAFFATGKFWVNNHAHIIRAVHGKADDYFIKAWFDQANISGYITGAAQPKLSQANLKRIQVHLPPLPTQRKIAAILSAYDDLIENNTRRIKILEEMAQTLYRHWFVDYKFPGHENVRLVDSDLGKIPESWEIVPLEAACELITDGAHQSPPTIDGPGFPMASVKDMTPWDLNISTCRIIGEDNYQKLVKANCKPYKGDVLVAKDGSYLKHIFVTNKERDIVLLSSIAILRPNEKIRPHVLSFYLKMPFVKNRMIGYVSGVAIPRIVLKDFRLFPIVLPQKNVQDVFIEKVSPIIDLIYTLLEKNENLRITRDILLPRLVKGELDIKELKIDFGG